MAKVTITIDDEEDEKIRVDFMFHDVPKDDPMKRKAAEIRTVAEVFAMEMINEFCCDNREIITGITVNIDIAAVKEFYDTMDLLCNGHAVGSC